MSNLLYYLYDEPISISDECFASGGEGSVYKLENAKLLKLFKTPDECNSPEAKKNVLLKLDEYQKKIPQLSPFSHGHIIFPDDPVYDKIGNDRRLVGYTMRFIDNAFDLSDLVSSSFREKKNISNNDIVAIFKKLHRLVNALHKKGIVIGDFSVNNVLIQGLDPFIIDTDSFQFNGFKTRVNTEETLDPVICKNIDGEFSKYSDNSFFTDWYSFAAMFFNSLLLVKP